MEIAKKELTAIVKSMRKNLSAQHKVDVPSTALRAVLLQALGENPHAFAKKTSEAMPNEKSLKELITEAPKFFAIDDFDGEKLDWLKRAGLVGGVNRAAEQLSEHTLYLSEDDVGCLVNLSFDDSDSMSFELERHMPGVTVTSISAQIPSVKKYGLPDYLQNRVQFFTETIHCEVAADCAVEYVDLHDDSGDTCKIVVRCSDDDWLDIVSQALGQNEWLWDDVAEWVGLHYSVNFNAESHFKRVDWTRRYLDSLN